MASKARVSPPKSSSGHIIRDSALGLVPETIDAYLALNESIWKQGPLSAAEVEMIRLRNARTVNCVFCKAVRYDIAKDAGLDEDTVQLIDEDYKNSTLSHRHKLLLEFTDLYLQDPRQLTDQLKTILLAEFSPQELIHASLAVVLFNTFSRCAVALGGMPDELPLMELSLPS
ncbi:MAG: carboxymuconolactone decarboxylase family protein [Pseudomonadales bacterium]